MTNPNIMTVLHVPAREIPLPLHLSPDAQAQLANMTMALPPWPAPEDIEAWQRLIAEMDEAGGVGFSMFTQHIEASVEEIRVDGVNVYSVTPSGIQADDQSVYLEVHGGALLWGGGASCRAMGLISADMMRAKTWAVDYRMPPDHPYPAAVDDCVAAYKALLRQHPASKIIIGGSSAGGNIAAATILRARDEGLPLPAAAVLMTPEIDLTESGDSFNSLLGIDTALTSRLMPANLLYADGHDLTDPYVSPIFGDFTKGFPPTFLQSGTRDLFLSNTVRMHRALRQANVIAELHVFEAANHVMFFSGPESADRTREVRRFTEDHWHRAPPHNW